MDINPIYWDSSYEIVLRLIDTYPNVDVETVGTGQLYEWVVSLPEFADDPSLANEGILNDILREWYEEVSSA
ncbi:MAG: Fe-S cluster assembly protein IscX [Anaerolineae bacterium]|nr:Fe-S cluster assembly protein IscX [Anaerolineae bacterium]